MVNGAGKKQCLLHQLDDGWLDCFFALHTDSISGGGGGEKRKRKEERVVRILRRFELHGVT